MTNTTPADTAPMNPNLLDGRFPFTRRPDYYGASRAAGYDAGYLAALRDISALVRSGSRLGEVVEFIVAATNEVDE